LAGNSLRRPGFVTVVLLDLAAVGLVAGRVPVYLT
jgi:hypothetical protein